MASPSDQSVATGGVATAAPGGAATPPDYRPDPAAPGWLRYVAMLTGVFAGVAGYLTVRSADLSNDAIFHSNLGVLYQSQASDAWAEYQAASLKAHVVETQLTAGTLAPAARASLEDEATKLRQRQPALEVKAKGIESLRDNELRVGGSRLGEKNFLAYASMSVQLGIALASVAALTRRRPAFVSGLIMGIIGIAITAASLMKHYFPG